MATTVKQTPLTATLAQIRRTIVAAQGFASRYRRAEGSDVEAAIRRLSAVQLDSISTVDRAHRLTLSARIGAFDPAPCGLRGDHRFSPWEAFPPKNGIAGVVRLAASDQFRRSMA